jgi:hypothetical protein
MGIIVTFSACCYTLLGIPNPDPWGPFQLAHPRLYDPRKREAGGQIQEMGDEHNNILN